MTWRGLWAQSDGVCSTPALTAPLRCPEDQLDPRAVGETMSPTPGDAAELNLTPAAPRAEGTECPPGCSGVMATQDTHGESRQQKARPSDTSAATPNGPPGQWHNDPDPTHQQARCGGEWGVPPATSSTAGRASYRLLECHHTDASSSPSHCGLVSFRADFPSNRGAEAAMRLKSLGLRVSGEGETSHHDERRTPKVPWAES